MIFQSRSHGGVVTRRGRARSSLSKENVLQEMIVHCGPQPHAARSLLPQCDPLQPPNDNSNYGGVVVQGRGARELFIDCLLISDKIQTGNYSSQTFLTTACAPTA